MIPFLRQVARHYVTQDAVENLCFVFPSRRSVVFFRKWLAVEAAAAGRTLVAPLCLPIKDFLFAAAGAKTAEKVYLILKLYDCYSALNPEAESLDDFVYWGDVLLTDFDDVDKYLGDPAKVFTNVSDFKSIRDDGSYLSDTQRNAISRLLHEGPEESRYRGRFLQLWNILYPLYRDFRAALRKEGLSTEGMVYRTLAERLTGRAQLPGANQTGSAHESGSQAQSAADVFGAAFPGRRFVFVGLNALNECEHTILSRLRDARLAEFCWDFSSAMIKDPGNRSSFFMRDNISDFPQAFQPDAEGLDEPKIRVTGVPSSTGQAKLLPRILKEIDADGLNTVVVLPDESLLLPVLHSLPEEVGELNVTMGYPVQSSEFFALVGEIGALQMHVRMNGEQPCFYNRQVGELLSNSVLRAAIGEEEASECRKIRAAGQYYIPQSAFADRSELVAGIFTAVLPPSPEPGDNTALSSYLSSVITGIADALDGVPGMELEYEFALRCLRTANMLRSFVHRPILPSTYIRLLLQMLSVESVPFEGEPLQGLQLMGPLETRSLDFENVIILSCNEGVFPHHSSSASFIPPELRTAFGLPTYMHQDAMWAYYFYRLIQRARNVWLLYDSRGEKLRSGEESRYVKQLELHFGLDLERSVAQAPVVPAEDDTSIDKTASDMEAIRNMVYSATTLQNYIQCPAKFYYGDVLRLKDQEDIDEALDFGGIGNVFHSVMEDLYRVPDDCDSRVISEAELRGMNSDRERIAAMVEAQIKEKMKTFEVSGKNLIYKDLICRYVHQTLLSDLRLIKAKGVDSFRVLGVERRLEGDLDGYRFKGFIDRVDSFIPGQTRVVDYKTGHVCDAEMDPGSEPAESVCEAVFSRPADNWPKIVLQLYIYDELMKARLGKGALLNSIYHVGRMFREPIRESEMPEALAEVIRPRLKALMDEIHDPSVPFVRKSSEKNCEYCDFKIICGK